MHISLAAGIWRRSERICGQAD